MVDASKAAVTSMAKGKELQQATPARALSLFEERGRLFDAFGRLGRCERRHEMRKALDQIAFRFK